ncbi:hypothetical protein H2200_001666 [Cladophialophora chaetospira]|uniref:Arabinanase/levansucrase/invertase n=1 Tax=Cladophialophora chaetospira TaxID=386627 RepID=A0AA38XLD9_9EURO|nr:hypothetical protein H2200_001666 [Cladophialophora chaetospira]
MRSFITWFLAFCALVASVVTAADSSKQSTVVFTNTRRLLFDVDGNQIDAYGSKINYFNGTYYLYGNSFSVTGTAFGIKSYSSIDLVNWKYQGYLYNPFVPNPCDDLGGCGRPHIVFNDQTGTYVLWMNAGNPGYVVATSSSPAGPFTFAGRAAIDPAFTALQPADFTVESLGGQGYLVFSVLNFRYPQAGSLWPPIQQTLHISQLTPDFLNTTQTSYNVTSAAVDLIDQEAESPDLFMRNGIFYVSASNTCGYCNGSTALIYRSKTIQGPWTRQIIAGDGCASQAEGVLPLSTGDNKTTYVWHGTSVPGGPRTGFSGHIFQPLQFNADGSIQDLICGADAQFSVAFTPGTGASVMGSATTSTDASPANATYSPVCDSDQWTLYQTWTASKTGTLQQVSVNIAASYQKAPLTLNVFKFSNLSALESPQYRWTELGNATYNATSLSYVFNTTSVFLNASVTKGDKLGVQISGSDFAPYCHLEYDVPVGSDQVLLQQGAGQNSWRGLNGKKSVIYQRVGKAVKTFTVVT